MGAASWALVLVVRNDLENDREGTEQLRWCHRFWSQMEHGSAPSLTTQTLCDSGSVTCPRVLPLNLSFQTTGSSTCLVTVTD